MRPLPLILAALALAGGAYLLIRSRDALASESAAQDPVGLEPPDPALAALDWIRDAVEEVTVSLWTIPPAGEPYAPAIAAAEDRYGIPRNLLARLLYQESRFRADIITGATRSPAGALGIAQFMPATAAEPGIDPLDVDQAIAAAGRYLAALYRRFGNWAEALAAYNWGQGNVARKGLDAAPRETRDYFSSILSDLGLA